MKITKNYLYSTGRATVALLAALALFGPFAARAGTILTGSSSANGNFAVLVGGFNNSVNGFASAVITGASNSVTAGNSFVGSGNRNQVVSPADSAAIVSGNDNVVSGVHGVVTGGTFNQSGGFASLIHGNFLRDGGNNGCVILSDSDPGAVRAGTPFTATGADTFTALFNNGFALRTSSTNGAQGLLIDATGNVTAGGKSVVVGDENLRTLRGSVQPNGTINNGTGFTAAKIATGHWRITFNEPFSSDTTPIAIADDASTPQIMTIDSSGPTQFGVRCWDTSNAAVDTNFRFIVTGPR